MLKTFLLLFTYLTVTYEASAAINQRVSPQMAAIAKKEITRACFKKLKARTNSDVAKFSYQVDPESTMLRATISISLVDRAQAICYGMWVPWTTENHPESYPTRLDFYPRR